VTVTVAEARQILLEEHLDRMTDPDKAADAARERVEQSLLDHHHDDGNRPYHYKREFEKLHR